MSIRTLASAIVALAALFVVALAPTGASAHAGHKHAHVKVEPAQTPGAMAVDRTGAGLNLVEASAHSAPIHDLPAERACDRGCCNAGHCSGCGTALAPSTWTGLRPASRIRLLNPDASVLAGLAFEGPPRPPKPFA
jgi:hypothetical protein